MTKLVLNKKQQALWPLLLKFKKDFGLVGGTAIALQLKHRQSIDFDLFTIKKLDHAVIRRQLVAMKYGIEQVLVDSPEEFTIVVKGVKLTFLSFPFTIKFQESYQELPLANLLTLSAMKAYALGRRAKWKDYVDILFIARELGGISPIIKMAEKIFGNEFNEKIFREQLAYFKDIDYSEEVEYLPGQAVSALTVKKSLKKLSLE